MFVSTYANKILLDGAAERVLFLNGLIFRDYLRSFDCFPTALVLLSFYVIAVEVMLFRRFFFVVFFFLIYTIAFCDFCSFTSYVDNLMSEVSS